MKTFILRHKRSIAVIAIIIFAVISIIILKDGNLRVGHTIRNIRNFIKSYGDLSAIAIILLVLVSTLIPPLPLPVPLLEIVSGLVFGFWAGLIISIIAQVLSSSFAFYLSRILGRKLLRKMFKNTFFTSYKDYINKNGAMAVLTLRATIGAPFNMVSFLAGLTDMSFKSFFLATLLGCIPEVILFTFIGTSLQTTRIRLWYIFAFVIILGAIGMISTLWIIKRKK